jgi:molecular chaperone DnaK
MNAPTFGIDLGTTASAIGWVDRGVPRLIPIDGSSLVPSIVMYGDEILIGSRARNALPLDPERAVLSSKRVMGTDHRFRTGEREVTPVDVAEQILRYLVDGAQREVGIRPERVVITVPAWFTQAQRADTRLAGERAGLRVERIVNEPTAAALAHAHGQDLTRKVLVYDLGGGTFDVSVVHQDGPVVEVLASHGDSRLGGDDIDLALVEHLLRRLTETDQELARAVGTSAAARVRLRLAAEATKIELSEAISATVRVPFLLDLDGRPRHIEIPIDRTDLERISAPFIERTLRSVDQVLSDADLNPGDLDELLLVGGATLQPLVWHMLHERYGLEGSHAIAPRDVVALGAAIQGAIVDGSRTDGILVDVAPYPLSVGVVTGPLAGLQTHYVCKVLTPRNTPLPARHAERFSTTHAGQRGVRLYVFQGSSIDPRQNVLLGRVELQDLDPAPPGEAGRPLVVAFRHDVDGLVQVELTDERSGRTARGQVAADGAEQADLQDELLQELDGLVLGDGSEPEEEEALDEGSVVESDQGPLAEARATFAAVIEAQPRLAAEHGAAAEPLVAMARAGQVALDEGRDDDALASYDDLSDRMFAMGIYL